MSGLLRIPFGVRVSDGAWVGPEDVERGLACGCICPSCKLPLKKNACKEKVDHFSHHTRQQQEKVKKDCEYSFWVALATMARQLLGGGGRLQTPAFERVMHYPDSIGADRRPPLYRMATIAKASSISFAPDDIAVSSVFDGALADAVIKVSGVSIVVVLVHPEREWSWAESLRGEKTCVLKIDLAGLDKVYAELRGADSFKERIRRRLFDETFGKIWLFHHRQEAQEQKALDDLKQQWEAQLQEEAERRQQVSSQRAALRRVPKDQSGLNLNRQVHTFECRCGRRWKACLPDENIYCPGCGVLARGMARIVSTP